jgi:hypothetical protein
MHQAPWTPDVGHCSLTKRDKINSRASQSDPGGKLIFASRYQPHRSTAVLCKYRQAHLGYLDTKRKPKAIGTLAAS